MSSVGYHEPIEELSATTRDMHRAIVSLMEELEAVDWYNQRVNACQDEQLKAILEHNRDEEKEHASMLVEWIQRKDPWFSKQLKDYVFTTKPIAHKEKRLFPGRMIAAGIADPAMCGSVPTLSVPLPNLLLRIRQSAWPTAARPGSPSGMQSRFSVRNRVRFIPFTNDWSQS